MDSGVDVDAAARRRRRIGRSVERASGGGWKCVDGTAASARVRACVNDAVRRMHYEYLVRRRGGRGGRGGRRDRRARGVFEVGLGVERAENHEHAGPLLPGEGVEEDETTE